ncbi:MAG TPA: alpha/beta fold hydrolase [Polyangiaceae bacterium]|nr:alpha/beta fold hydrolase [Polyangiaceae bacterium]
MTKPFFPAVERMAASPDARPTKWLFVLHGVFGSGRNWQLFCRAIARQRPEWGFLLVDQRGHGDSMGAPPPHTVEAMAEDLVALESRLDLPVVGVLGHSLGGKVALAYAARRADRLDEVWILDSQPGAREESPQAATRQAMDVLRALPARFADREAFVTIVEEMGQPKAIAQWLAMNLRPADGGMRLHLELDRIAAILADYFARDLWPEVERLDERRRLHVVVAGASAIWSCDDRDRLEAIAAQNAAVVPHVIEGAGHWVHVDAADEVRRLFVGELG